MFAILWYASIAHWKNKDALNKLHKVNEAWLNENKLLIAIVDIYEQECDNS